MKELDLQVLVGRKVLKAFIDRQDDFIVLETDKGLLYLAWEGSCCAHCFITHITGTSNFIDSTVLSVNNTEWSRHRGENETVDTMGTTLQTSKGTVTIETRVEHNGYYGGEIKVFDENPYRASTYALKPLEDK